MNVMQRQNHNEIRHGDQEIFLVLADQERRRKNCLCNPRGDPLVSTLVTPMVFVFLTFVQKDSHFVCV